MACLIPLTFGDDLDWGGPAGIERLNNWFDNYNGRYFGNILIITISRFAIFRVLLYGVINTMIVYGVMRLSNAKNRFVPFVVTGLLLLIPYSVYAQTFSWFSGFVNYNVGIALTLLIWTLVLKGSERFYPAKIVLLLVLSFLVQLCMENITMFNVLFSIIFLVVLFKKKLVGYRLTYLVGSILGAAIMFSNSVYHTIASGDDGYRTFDLEKIRTVFFTHYLQSYLFNNWLILALIAILIWTLYQNKNKLMLIPLFVITAFPIFAMMLSVAHIELAELSLSLATVFGFVSLIYLIMLLFAIRGLEDVNIKENFWMIFLFGASSGIVLAPFLIVTPFGPRAGLASYVFFVMIAITLLNALLARETVKVNIWRFNYLAAVFFISVSIIFIGIHSVNLYYFNKRNVLIKIDDKAKTATVKRLPFDQYTHYISPPNYGEIAPRTFREKYDIPKDYKVVSVPYKLD